MPGKPFSAHPPPAPRVEIMRLYARMSDTQRKALLAAAEVIAATADVWADTVPVGGHETNAAAFDPAE